MRAPRTRAPIPDLVQHGPFRQGQLIMPKQVNTILVADDESEIRSYLGAALGSQGYRVEYADNGNDVLERVRPGNDPDGAGVALVLLDILMPDKDGLQTLEELRRIRPEVPVIMLSGASSPGNIVTAMKGGAIDFLAKPVSYRDLADAVQKVLPADENPQVPETLSSEPILPVVGAWSRKLDLLVQRIGASDVPVLLQGETGVGKEVLARKLHAKSMRSGHPFLKLNCAALPSELVESELFGYERGAFTGAFKNTPGKFEMANHGTILLDEIGDMDFKLQAKLLQVVQDHEFLRLGAKETVKVDVRVMAATHCNLEQAIVEGRFREDLYYRLNIIDIQIPPLRERRDEILPLADFFLRTHTTPDKPPLGLTPGLRDALLEHDWSGNIRELENVMRKYLVLRNAEVVAEDLVRRAQKRSSALKQASKKTFAPVEPKVLHDAQPQDAVPPEPSDSSVLKGVNNAHRTAEAEVIIAALNAALWNRKQAAASLKIDYKALLYKMKKLGIGDKKSVA
jgi:two-component system response regulator AtoC